MDGTELVHRAGDEERRDARSTSIRLVRPPGSPTGTRLGAAVLDGCSWHRGRRGRGRAHAGPAVARALRHRDRAGRRSRPAGAPTTASRPATSSTPEPYAYVGPWTAEVAGELWQANGFRGAELTYAELLAAPDQRAAALEFFTHPRRRRSHERRTACSGTGCSRPTSCPRAASPRSRPATRASRSSTSTGSSPRSTTTAPTRAARSARARSRTGCCAAPGTATTTARSTAARPGSTTRRPPIRSRSATARSTSASQAEPHVATVSDLMAETMVNWGVEHVFGMVGHSNLGLADALRRQEEAGKLTYIGIRHEGAAAFAASRLRQAHRPPGGLPDDRRARRDEPADRAVGRQGRPRAGARAHRPGQHAGARARARSRRSTCPARSARSPPGASPCCATPTRSS